MKDIRPPANLPDCRQPGMIRGDHARADEFATKGSVKHFLLRQGFMPNNEEDAEAILIRIIRELEWYETWVEYHRCNE